MGQQLPIFRKRGGSPGAWVTDEPAGGCGRCYGVISKRPAAAAGTAAHLVVQAAAQSYFGPYARPEFRFSSPTDENGRLDLLVATKRGFKIAEIKPSNPKGEKQGIEDIRWYKQKLKETYPDKKVELLDQRIPVGQGLLMPDPVAHMAGCPPQKLAVAPMRLGVYGYWCAPSFRELLRVCTCRPLVPPPVPVPERKLVPQQAPARVPKPESTRRRIPPPEAFIPPMVAYGLYKLYQTAVQTSPALRFAFAAPAPAAPAPAAPAPAVGGGPGLGLGLRVAIISGSAALSLGGAYALAKHTYGSVVPGAVAAALGEHYAAMDAAVAKIERWYGKTQDAKDKVDDLLFTTESLVPANSELRGVLRPLHEGVFEASRAINSAERNMQAIADRVKSRDELILAFQNIKSLMRNGSYPPLDSPDLAEIARLVLDAADLLKAMIRRLHAEREQIIESQSHYEMKRR